MSLLRRANLVNSTQAFERENMDFGLFIAPYTTAYLEGRKSASEVIDWDLEITTWADELGLAEAFYAEHYTIGYEPSPAPDSMVALAAGRTEQIRLGAGAHLLPYHNPISLAHRLLWLDHMTKGRYIAGFAPGSYPTDAQLFGTGNDNPEMMVEALDIIEAIWTREPPFRLEGKYWTVDMPEFTELWGGPHLKPFTSPHPEVIMTGMQANSPTFGEAGRRGFSPISQQVGVHVLAQQWDNYAAVVEESGGKPDRANWRVIRDVFVAETDEEARRLVLDGAAAKTWDAHILPAFKKVRARSGQRAYAIGELLLDPGMDIEELTTEWLVDNFWLVGSPDTVAEKIRKFDAEIGGVGSILSFGFDYSDDAASYRRSMELLSQEVTPALADVGARAAAKQPAG
jgi:alkanesulfonate monooxygenase SsuD/methylene tetrahydromethanopterin reductase-like flavin-dependent oxidoreductase (luciferase family)